MKRIRRLSSVHLQQAVLYVHEAPEGPARVFVKVSERCIMAIAQDLTCKGVDTHRDFTGSAEYIVRSFQPEHRWIACGYNQFQDISRNKVLLVQ